MTIIGVDPGQKGAFAVLDKCQVQVFAWDNQLFAQEVRKIAENRGEEQIFAVVEKVGAMPGQGVVSMFNFGKSAGFIEGVLEAFGIQTLLVPPQRWKKSYNLGSDKQKSIEKCQEMHPELSLLPTPRCKKPSDGMAEAVLIAEYGKSIVCGNSAFENERNGKKKRSDSDGK